MKLRFERGALADLDEILSYIAQDNRPAAARLAARIEEAAARIAQTPYMGEATRKSRFRRFPVGNYLLVYEVGEDEVIIHYCSDSDGPIPDRQPGTPANPILCDAAPTQ